MTHPIARHKILSCYQEIRALQRGDMPAPRTVELFVTSACNHNCTGCHTRGLRRARAAHLNIVRAEALLDEWRAMGVEGLEISGIGEPLLYPHLERLLQSAHARGFRAGLLTNGSRLHTADPEVLLRTTRFIRIAFDAADPKTYRAVHGADDLARVEQNVAALLETRGRVGAKTTIGLKALLSKRNKHEIAAMARRARALGVDYVQFKPLRQCRASLCAEECAAAQRDIDAVRREMASRNSGFRVLGGAGREVLSRGCFLSPLHPVVDPHATLFVCPYYTHHAGAHRIGSLRNKPFAALWGSDAHRRCIQATDPAICNTFDCPLIPYNNYAAAAILDDSMHLSIV